MAKVSLNLWINGPPIGTLGDIHGTLKKFTCADLATEIDPEGVIISPIQFSEDHPYWTINDEEVRMYSMHIDATQLDYVLTQGCEPILNIGMDAIEVGTDEYNLAYGPNATFTAVNLTSKPDDWDRCGHTKYYQKTDATDSDSRTWHCFNPIGWNAQNHEFLPIGFNAGTYYVTDKPAAVDIYFNSNAHIGIAARQIVDSQMSLIDNYRYFAPNLYSWRPTYPDINGDMPGLWDAFWAYGGGWPGMIEQNAGTYGIPTGQVVNGTYVYRYKYYAFAHQMDPLNTGTPETYIGFLYTIEDSLGGILQANALLMSQAVASGVVKTPDGGEISGIEGGDGDWDDSSDDDDNMDGDESETDSNSWNGGREDYTQGYNRYLMQASVDAPPFKQMVQHLWDPDTWDGFENKYLNPIEGIIACYMIPAWFAPIKSGETDYIYAATVKLSEDKAPLFNSNNACFHLGTFSTGKYTDSFADFTDSAIYIHLPFIGTKQLDVDLCMQGRIGVDYQVDYFTGDITAQITTEDRFGNQKLTYEFKGNCAIQIPLRQRVPIATNLIGGGAQVVSKAATAVALGAIGEGAAAVYDASWAGLSMGEQMSNIGWALSESKDTLVAAGLGAGVGNLSTLASVAGQSMTSSSIASSSVTSLVDTRCFITIIHPQWSNPAGYDWLFGYPSDLGGTINMSETDELGQRRPFRGYLSVRNVELKGIAATTEERAEIEQLLKSGVYTSTREEINS